MILCGCGNEMEGAAGVDLIRCSPTMPDVFAVSLPLDWSQKNMPTHQPPRPGQTETVKRRSSRLPAATLFGLASAADEAT